MITSGATSDDKVGIMATLGFREHDILEYSRHMPTVKTPDMFSALP